MNPRFVLAGARAGEAADCLSAVLGSDGAIVTREAPEASDEATRRAIDLIALATLILSVPPAMLAVVDLADRIAKRQKARKILKAAGEIRAELDVDTFLIGHDGTTYPLAGLDADRLLDIAAFKDSDER